MELEGTAELNFWCLIGDGYEVLLKPTKEPRRFRVKVRERPKEKRVRHRRHLGRLLTDGPHKG